MTYLTGRKSELKTLEGLWEKQTATLVVVKGRRRIGKSRLIDEVQTKIARLKFPRGFSYRPVLIHVNGVSTEVIEKNYFAKIIGFAELLT